MNTVEAFGGGYGITRQSAVCSVYYYREGYINVLQQKCSHSHGLRMQGGSASVARLALGWTTCVANPWVTASSGEFFFCTDGCIGHFITNAEDSPRAEPSLGVGSGQQLDKNIHSVNPSLRLSEMEACRCRASAIEERSRHSFIAIPISRLSESSCFFHLPAAGIQLVLLGYSVCPLRPVSVFTVTCSGIPHGRKGSKKKKIRGRWGSVLRSLSVGQGLYA